MDNPTYRHLGDHAETIEIKYDLSEITYAELLEVFWRSHDPRSRPWSRQYMSAIYYHNETQKRLALESYEREKSRAVGKIHTEIVPGSRFYGAEDYHQKYYLRQKKEVIGLLKGLYPSDEELVGSTAAARLNGYFGGYLGFAELEKEMNEYNFRTEECKKILGLLRATSH